MLELKELFYKIEYISVDVGPERGIEQISTKAPVTELLLQNNFEIVLIP